MEKDFKILFIVVLIILTVSGALIYFSNYHNFLNNNNTTTSNVSNSKIVVAASVLPQKEFIEKVGGDKVQVIVMVPPGGDPHTYEPKASQMEQIANAQMYVQVGSGIDFEMTWIDKIKSLNRNMLVINDSKGITFIPSIENISNTEQNGENFSSTGINTGITESDPHVWVSPKNAQVMVENIYQGLVKIDPKNKEYYLINKENYLKELRQLDKNITSELSNQKGSKILVYHPSWEYFCHDYGMTQIAIEKEGKDPTPKEMMNIINLSKKDNITAIFVSPQYNTRSSEVIASEIGAKLIFIDELAPDYVDNMRKIVNAFENG
ncbi:MAG: zinc ABC transporter substrate-binding protein [Methanobacteriaceae archaeon]|nr:zinc ABC transporter substrate-binding protein [Methanobacteriaceae archaeon]